ncbi:MAG: hypothetical protein ACRECV_10300 [Xanthobacteraceae bacterium]
MSVVALGPRKAADKPKHRVTKQLELFALRCFDLADRVAAGNLDFIDAVDFAYSAAVWADLPATIDASGLIDRNRSGAPTGNDVIQQTISVAFADLRPAQ